MFVVKGLNRRKESKECVSWCRKHDNNWKRREGRNNVSSRILLDCTWSCWSSSSSYEENRYSVSRLQGRKGKSAACREKETGREREGERKRERTDEAVGTQSWMWAERRKTMRLRNGVNGNEGRMKRWMEKELEGNRRARPHRSPTSPNCWWLRHLLPLTANHLHPGGSKPRHGQKKGSKVKEHVQEGWSWYKEQQNVLWHRTKRLEYKSKAVKALKCKNNNKIFPTEESCSKGCSRLHPSQNRT